MPLPYWAFGMWKRRFKLHEAKTLFALSRKSNKMLAPAAFAHSLFKHLRAYPSNIRVKQIPRLRTHLLDPRALLGT